jgi:hypothetical protein
MSLNFNLNQTKINKRNDALVLLFCHSRENGNPEPVKEKSWIPCIKWGQALLEFIPMNIGAGMTTLDNNLTSFQPNASP